MRSRAASSFWVCFAMVAGLMGTALISPLYPLYADAWDLQVSQVTLIYVVYMSGALGALLFFGRLADLTHFRTLIIIALCLSGTGTLVSMFAPDIVALYGGRFLVGVAASLITPACTVALATVTPPALRQQLPLVSGILLSVGFGLGPLLGGIMGTWAPWPLLVSYLPAMALIVAALAGVALTLPAARPQGSSRLRPADFLPRLTAPEPGRRALFAVACGLPFASFGVFGVYASLAPLFIEQNMGWDGPLVSGLSIAFILLASALIQLAARQVATFHITLAGLAALACCNVALVANMYVSNVTVFIMGLALTAMGNSLLMLAGMQVVNVVAGPANRAGLTSTYLAVGYAGSIAPLLAMGQIADRWGLRAGVVSFSVLVITLCACLAPAFIICWRRSQRHTL